MHLLVIILFISFCIAYLCGLFDAYKVGYISQSNGEKALLIEYLTQYKNRTKNYKNTPQDFTSYNKRLNVYKVEDKVNLNYEFPLIHRQKSYFKGTLIPEQVSQSVNLFGIRQNYIKKIDENTITINNQYDDKILKFEFINGCWYFFGITNWGIDYARLVHYNANFSLSIAKHIHESLDLIKADTYLNRVQAALNFVQFIPYGKPQFDTNDWYYHEVAIPYESIVLGYSDCDSKSIFLATILIHLVPKENIVLVDCLVRSTNEKTNGAHMMVAVHDLGLNGESISFNNKNYLLLETTIPCIMGKSDWEELKVQNIIPL